MTKWNQQGHADSRRPGGPKIAGGPRPLVRRKFGRAGRAFHPTPCFATTSISSCESNRSFPSIQYVNRPAQEDACRSAVPASGSSFSAFCTLGRRLTVYHTFGAAVSSDGVLAFAPPGKSPSPRAFAPDIRPHLTATLRAPAAAASRRCTEPRPPSTPASGQRPCRRRLALPAASSKAQRSVWASRVANQRYHCTTFCVFCIRCRLLSVSFSTHAFRHCASRS